MDFKLSSFLLMANTFYGWIEVAVGFVFNRMHAIFDVFLVCRVKPLGL